MNEAYSRERDARAALQAAQAFSDGVGGSASVGGGGSAVLAGASAWKKLGGGPRVRCCVDELVSVNETDGAYT